MSGESASAKVEAATPGDPMKSVRKVAATVGYVSVYAALVLAFLCVMLDKFGTWWAITLFSLFGAACGAEPQSPSAPKGTCP